MIDMLHKKKKEVSLPTKSQVETERKRYRRQKAYKKALRGTVCVLTIVAAVAVLIATLILPVLQIEGTSMEPTLSNGDIVVFGSSEFTNLYNVLEVQRRILDDYKDDIAKYSTKTLSVGTFLSPTGGKT